MLRNIQSGNDIINLMNDGTPELVAKRFAVQKFEDGRFELQIAAKSVEEIAAYIKHIAAQLGCTEEQVRSLLKPPTTGPIDRKRRRMHHTNARSVFRAAAKVVPHVSDQGDGE